MSVPFTAGTVASPTSVAVTQSYAGPALQTHVVLGDWEAHTPPQLCKWPRV